MRSLPHAGAHAHAHAEAHAGVVRDAHEPSLGSGREGAGHLPRKGLQALGCISQFDAATGLDSFRAQASYRNETYWYSDGVNAFFSGDEAMLADFVAKDVVAMTVLSLGSYSYDTQNGGNMTVPMFQIVTIKRISGSC